VVLTSLGLEAMPSFVSIDFPGAWLRARWGHFWQFEFPTSLDTFALGINPRGDITGQYKMTDGWHGLVTSRRLHPTQTEIHFRPASVTCPA
jgi:hypothetical protein